MVLFVDNWIFCPLLESLALCQLTKFHNFLWVCWFFAKYVVCSVIDGPRGTISNFVSLPWKLETHITILWNSSCFNCSATSKHVRASVFRWLAPAAFVSRSWAKIWTQSISGLSSFFKLQFWQEASIFPSTSFLAGFSENAITCSICQLPRVCERMSCEETRIIIYICR